MMRKLLCSLSVLQNVITLPPQPTASVTTMVGRFQGTFMPTCIKYRKIKYQQEDFLGPDICNSAMVRDNKLTEQKRNELE